LKEPNRTCRNETITISLNNKMKETSSRLNVAEERHREHKALGV
jgi:hypothetical protein